MDRAPRNDAPDDQPDTTNKWMIGGAAGALVIILTWALKTWAHVELPAEVGQSLTLLIGVGAAHLTPVGKRNDPPPSA